MSAAHGATTRGPERLRGPLSNVPATTKLLGLVVFLVAVAVTPNSRADLLGVGLLVAIVVASVAYVDWRAVVRRLSFDVPLVVLAVTQAFLGRGPEIEVAGIGLSRPGLVVGLGVLAKATVGVVAVSAVAASTTAPETIAALRRLGLPVWFCQLVALSARQIDVLRADLARLRLATALRAPSAGRRAAWSVGARSLGALFVRSTERADRLQVAAELRGGGRGEVRQ